MSIYFRSCLFLYHPFKYREKTEQNCEIKRSARIQQDPDLLRAQSKDAIPHTGYMFYVIQKFGTPNKMKLLHSLITDI